MSLSNVPSMMVSNTFLDKNSQAHASAMTAFGDIIDNGRESGASKLSIEVRTHRGRPMLVVSDNGTGMTEAKVREGLMSIGYTSKDLSTGKHYGFGGKTAIPRVADSALIFTREAQTRNRTVGLLSTVLSERLGSTETKMPLCSWEAAHKGNAIVGSSSDLAPLTQSQREASVHFMLEAADCPYASAEQLLQEFDRKWPGSSHGATGTRLVMWGLKKDIHVKQRGDILVDAPPGAASHQRSLRAYAEVLYLKVGTKVQPSMSIDLRDSAVTPRDWQEYLVEMRQEYALPKPHSSEVAAQFKAESGNAPAQTMSREAMANMTIGYARPRRDIISVHSPRKSADDDVTGAAEEKGEIAVEETGFFVYHKGRMTRMLEKVKTQTKMNNAAMTSKLRITQMGEGLTGFILETYMLQTHNKSAYLDSRLFDSLMTNANLKVKDYLRRFSCRKHGEVSGYLPVGLPEAEPEQPAKKPEKGPKEKVPVLDEEVRMRPVNPNDPTVGRVVKSPFAKGRYQLRRPDFTLSERSYYARELVPTVFDPTKDLEHGMVAAPRALAGASALVWWLPDHEGETGQFWEATLRVPHPGWASPAIGEGKAGWFLLTYGDGFEEAFFIALRPGDATIYAAYRDDGERLPGGIEFKIQDESSSQLAMVVEMLRRTPLLATHEEQAAPQGNAGPSSSGQSPIAAAAVAGLPAVNTIRYEILEAICAGNIDRDAIVRKTRGHKGDRQQIVTALGKEKQMKTPLWVQNDATYTLTAGGKAAAEAGGIAVADGTMVAAEPVEVIDDDEAEVIEVEVEVNEEMFDVEAERSSAEPFTGDGGASPGKRGRGRPAGQKNKPGHNAGRPRHDGQPKHSKSSLIAAAAASSSTLMDAVHHADRIVAAAAGAQHTTPLKSVRLLLRKPTPDAEASEPEAECAAAAPPPPTLPEVAAPPTLPSAVQPPSFAPIVVEAEAPAAAPLETTRAFHVGQRVKAKYLASDPTIRATAAERSRGFGPGRWYEGKIREVHEDGTYAVDYEDGDSETFVQPRFIVALIEEDDHEGESELVPLAAVNSNASSNNSGSSHASSGATLAGGASSSARRSTRRGPMTNRGAMAVADQSEPQPWKAAAQRDKALKRVSTLEGELAASRKSQARLRAQLRSVMEQAAALHESFSTSPAAQMLLHGPAAAGDDDQPQMPEGHAEAVAALGLRAQRFLSGEAEEEGDEEDDGVVVDAQLEEEDEQAESGEPLALANQLAGSNGSVATVTAAGEVDEPSPNVRTRSAPGASSPIVSAPATDASGKASADEIKVGSRVRVWFTKMMLHSRNDEDARFESGVVTWVGDKELARRGGVTVRFRVKYDDGANHEHVLQEEHVEIVKSKAGGKRKASVDSVASAPSKAVKRES